MRADKANAADCISNMQCRKIERICNVTVFNVLFVFIRRDTKYQFTRAAHINLRSGSVNLCLCSRNHFSRCFGFSSTLLNSEPVANWIELDLNLYYIFCLSLYAYWAIFEREKTYIFILFTIKLVCLLNK